MLRKYVLSPSRNGGPHARVSSPRPGCSTLITRAPRSPSSIVQYGPDNTRVKIQHRDPVERAGRWYHGAILICRWSGWRQHMVSKGSCCRCARPVRGDGVRAESALHRRLRPLTP